MPEGTEGYYTRSKERNREDTIGQFMKAIETNISDVKKDVNVLNGIMEERERENKEIMKNLDVRCIEMEKRGREDNEDINRKMNKLEEVLRRSSVTKPRQQTLQQMEYKDTVICSASWRAETQATTSLVTPLTNQVTAI